MTGGQTGEDWATGLVGTTLARRYQLVRLLGAGGMGAVFEALNTALDRRIAIKVLLPHLAGNQMAVQRFQREARAAAKVAGHGIAEIIDLDIDESVGSFMILELLRGESLFERLDRTRVLSPPQTIAYVSALLLTLARVHEHGIIHRDLKPENVFVAATAAGDVVKILDFGVAHMVSGQSAIELTRPGSVLGTPAYMPPEQLRGSPPIDHRADLYAVGAIAYHCLTGRPPHDADTFGALIESVLSGNFTPLASLRPDLSAQLHQVVDRSLAADREQRFDSADAMRRTLETLTEASLSSPAGQGPTVQQGNPHIEAMHAATMPAASVGVAGVRAPEAARQASTGRVRPLLAGAVALTVAALVGLAVVAAMVVFDDVSPRTGDPATGPAPLFPTPESPVPASTALQAEQPALARIVPPPWDVAHLPSSRLVPESTSATAPGVQQAIDRAANLAGSGRREQAIAELEPVWRQMQQQEVAADVAIRAVWLQADLIAQRIDADEQESVRAAYVSWQNEYEQSWERYDTAGAHSHLVLGSCRLVKAGSLQMHIRHELDRVARSAPADPSLEGFRQGQLSVARPSFVAAAEADGPCAEEARELLARMPAVQ